jgi:hypothetical protein
MIGYGLFQGAVEATLVHSEIDHTNQMITVATSYIVHYLKPLNWALVNLTA